ncbi:unnamed protein product [Orchesella dallaii]|uniref:CHHC U11-48K-type domain-containing protein n=1 Tax=Orchesella dallaii TaxID=48710 RepID=A0ABP1RFC3_9HEXA
MAFVDSLKVDSKDSRINYNLLPGEELRTCPYNLSHAVLPIKFSKHVINCHRLHCKEQDKIGQPPLFAICRHDRSHHVRKELLANHESTCEARVHADQDDDYWGCGGGAAASTSKEESSDSKVGAQALSMGVKELERMEADEDWESEPSYNFKFDSEKRIRNLRMEGNTVVRYPTPGLSKSEKKEFYTKEEELMKGYAQHRFLQNGKDQNKSSYWSRSTTTASSTARSEYGLDDGILLPIQEEFPRTFGKNH